MPGLSIEPKSELHMLTNLQEAPAGGSTQLLGGIAKALRGGIFFLWIAMAFTLVTLLSACASRNFTIAVTESELAALVTPKFPIEHRVAQVLDVKLQSPQLRLLTDVAACAWRCKCGWQNVWAGEP
jgi:hypothetical protein